MEKDINLWQPETEKKSPPILESISSICYEMNTAGQIIDISPSVEQTLKYRRDELIGTFISELFVEKEKSEKLQKLIMKDGRINDYELYLKAKGGFPVFCSLSAHTISSDLKQQKDWSDNYNILFLCKAANRLKYSLTMKYIAEATPQKYYLVV
jgi:PAS domain S-box-containing protein